MTDSTRTASRRAQPQLKSERVQLLAPEPSAWEATAEGRLRWLRSFSGQDEALAVLAQAALLAEELGVQVALQYAECRVCVELEAPSLEELSEPQRALALRLEVVAESPNG